MHFAEEEKEHKKKIAPGHRQPGSQFQHSHPCGLLLKVKEEDAMLYLHFLY